MPAVYLPAPIIQSPFCGPRDIPVMTHTHVVWWFTIYFKWNVPYQTVKLPKSTQTLNKQPLCIIKKIAIKIDLCVYPPCSPTSKMIQDGSTKGHDQHHGQQLSTVEGVWQVVNLSGILDVHDASRQFLALLAQEVERSWEPLWNMGRSRLETTLPCCTSDPCMQLS